MAHAGFNRQCSSCRREMIMPMPTTLSENKMDKKSEADERPLEPGSALSYSLWAPSWFFFLKFISFVKIHPMKTDIHILYPDLYPICLCLPRVFIYKIGDLFICRCSSGFDRNRQDWVDLGCQQEVLSCTVKKYIYIFLKTNVTYVFPPPEKRFSVSPPSRLNKRHISTTPAHDHCSDHHHTAEGLQPGLRPHQDACCRQPLQPRQD